MISMRLEALSKGSGTHRVSSAFLMWPVKCETRSLFVFVLGFHSSIYSASASAPKLRSL